MAFHIGQKVVCVDDSRAGVDPRNWPGRTHCPNWPKKGEVYTVRDVFDRTIHLIEVVNPPARFKEKFGEAKFFQRRFRPLVEDKSESSFTQGADPSSDKWDNRRKVGADA